MSQQPSPMLPDTQHYMRVQAWEAIPTGVFHSPAKLVIYNTAFTLLNKAVHSPANPVKFLTDFEKALMQAMHRCQFPNSNNSQGLLLQLCPDNLEKEFKQLVFNCTGRLLGQHCSSCVLGETCLGTLPVQRGESTNSDETILAARYV